MAQLAMGDMYDYYKISKDSMEAFMGRGTYPSVKSHCARTNKGCEKTATHWCFHCESSYCGTHWNDHVHGLTDCKGPGKGWVISFENMEKGRCDRLLHKHNWGSSALLAQFPNCPKHVEYYCPHCEQWYCRQHCDDHIKGMTKCNGAKEDKYYKVSSKGK